MFRERDPQVSLWQSDVPGSAEEGQALGAELGQVFNEALD